MSHQIKAFATTDKPGKFQLQTRQERLNDFDLFIEIEAAGICHTVNTTSFPLVYTHGKHL